METENGLESLLQAFNTMLLEKNKRYGNAALAPLQIFSGKSKISPDAERLAVRLDEKLARIKVSDTLRINDVTDVAGYCILLLSAMEVGADDILAQID